MSEAYLGLDILPITGKPHPFATPSKVEQTHPIPSLNPIAVAVQAAYKDTDVN